MENDANAAIDTFVDNLVAEKGLLNLEPDILAQVKADLKDRVEDRINASLVENLPPEYLPEAQKLIETAEGDEIAQFFTKHIPDMAEVVASEMLAFRKTYLTTRV